MTDHWFERHADQFGACQPERLLERLFRGGNKEIRDLLGLWPVSHQLLRNVSAIGAGSAVKLKKTTLPPLAFAPDPPALPHSPSAQGHVCALPSTHSEINNCIFDCR